MDNQSLIKAGVFAFAGFAVLLLWRLRRTGSSRQPTDFVGEFDRLNRRNDGVGRAAEPPEEALSDDGIDDRKVPEPQDDRNGPRILRSNGRGAKKVVAQDLLVPEADSVCRALADAGIPFAVRQQHIDTAFHQYGNCGMGTTMYVVVNSGDFDRAARIIAARLLR